MVVHYLHEPKTLRPKSNLQSSELYQNGVLLAWINQLTSYPPTDLVRAKDGKLISMNQSTSQLPYHQFRDLLELLILSLQTSLLRLDGKEHWDQLEKIIPNIAFQITQDLLQKIYLLLFLHVQKAHLLPNQGLRQCH